MQLHTSSYEYSANRLGYCSTIPFVIDTHMAEQFSISITNAAGYGVNTYFPIVEPRAKLLQQLARAGTPLAVTRLSSAEVEKISNASYLTIALPLPHVTFSKSEEVTIS